MTDSEHVSVTWTYLGLRLDRNTKPYHLWRDHQGEERWYSKVAAPSSVVGGLYEVTLTGDDHSGVIYKGQQGPRFQGRGEDAHIPAWRAEHDLAQALVEAGRAAQRAKAESGGDLGNMTLREVARWYQGRALPAQKAGVLTVIIQYVQYGSVGE